jgi:hypothetical protein
MSAATPVQAEGARAFYEVPIDEWPAYLQLAAERLHVKFVGLTHELLLQVADVMRASLELAENHGEDGKLTIQGTLRVQEAAGKAWRAAMSQWRSSFEAARWEGAYLALATVARMHYHYFVEEAEAEPESGEGTGSAVTAQTEARSDRPRGLDEQVSPWWGAMRRGWPMGRPIPWVGDIDRVLKALEQRVYSDGFTLSQRIWRLDQVSLQGFRDTLYKGFLEGKTIWDVAADLEQFLGAGQDCPRWTKERLTLTPEEIAAGDETGLIRGDACAGQGVAYNALRLAVNEIQTAVQAMLREIHAQQPWVKGERLYLNDLHNVVYNCECERIAGYPPNMVSEVLPVGTVELPLHPWCMCVTLLERMTREEVQERLARWRQGEPWPEMEQYLLTLGLGQPVELPPAPPVAVPGGPPVPPPLPDDNSWLWWLLLLLLAEGYRRWTEADERETDEALQWNEEEQ